MVASIMDCTIFTFFFVHLCCLTFLTSHFSICTGSAEILCIPSEREALLRFKHHLNDSSNRLSSWNAVNPNCCEWAGVVCSNVTSHILQLHLNTSHPPSVFDLEYEASMRSMFGGEINPSLVDLKHLNYLDLSGNRFGGMQIPSFLCAITTLTYLNLSDAGFYGKIPDQIGNLSNLRYLDLTQAADGTIPYQIGNLSNLLHLGIGGYYDDELFAENLHWLSGLSSLQYLDLSYTNLSKSFDWLQTMQALPSLVELHLSGCMFHHYNQPSTVNFSSLVILDISYIKYPLGIPFVPNWILGLTKLISLQLSSDHIQGPIPNGIRNLTLLENLDLSYNSFSSSIPDWLYGLHHLKVLNLRSSNLHGTISDVLGNLTSLVSLDLSYNQLEGMIPTSLGNLTSLVSIDLSSNQLEGMIPTSFRNLCNLREISFLNLKLNQRVSEILEILTPCVSHELTVLDVYRCQLSGQLTDQIGMFKNLVSLDFSYNSIEGALPRSFGKLSSLRRLDLSNNKFNGNPFEILGSLSKLLYLSIGDNLFQGIVKEDDLANFTSIDVFSASGNNLTLKVGPNWRPSFQATTFGMTSWQLGPSFPLWIQSQKNLGYLGMSDTGISDSIPVWFWGIFPNYSLLDLSHNHINGELLNTLQNPIIFQSIDLSSNHLSGQLPHLSFEVIKLDLSSNYYSGSMTDFLCKKHDEQKSLTAFLYLASNNLTGEIPDCWLMWPNLVDVDLQSNYLVGNLPPSMGSLAWLDSLHIRNNTLSGIFPPILKNTSKLIVLDLGENKLTGIIPAWVGERLLNLRFLRLRSNRFLGRIPNQICALKLLQVLDLAQNNLSGNIPNCFNHLNAMTLKNKSSYSFILAIAGWEFSMINMLLWLKGRGDEFGKILGMVTSIDLSDNKLSGEIPREITDLGGLIFLNLSKNQLIGQIPQSIGNMRSLESIDFSRNQLLGEIPPSISNLSFLSKLDLSYNHLKGKIPTGTQLQSFEASNFIGNNLCGPPLPINCSSSAKIPNADQNDKESDGHGVNWFFVSMTFGFVVGFWVVVAPLFIYRSWRYVYYRFLDDMWYKIRYCW